MKSKRFKTLSISLSLALLFIFNGFAEDNLQRFNNISVYQHSENQNYKISLFTSLKKGTWFFQNIYDNFVTSDYNRVYDYYAITTAGKYINKKVSVRVQIEQGRNFHTNYYFGIGIDF